jgi:hypothetical protein
MFKKNLSEIGTPRYRFALNVMGGCLGLAGIVFVAVRLAQQTSEIKQYNFAQTQVVLFSTLAVVYGAANTFIAAGWYCILKRLGLTVSWKASFVTYGVSQLAKYVPGNIFQFVGRQALGVSAGMPGGKLARSAFIEIGFLVIAAVLLAVQAARLWLPQLSESVAYSATLILASLCFLLLIVRKEALLSVTLLLNMLFFMTAGVVFWAILTLLAGLTNAADAIPTVSSAFILAWLLGFLTPGAPAGIGIREYVILISLSGIASEPLLLLAVVISRVTTMVGDLVFYLAAMAVKYIPNRRRKISSET